MPCCSSCVSAHRNGDLTAAFSQVINLAWFKRRESKTDKRVLLETEGREEELQMLILQNTGGWTLEGDASEQLEALFKQEQEDKLSDPQADVLELCRERWREFQAHDPQGRGSALRQLQGQGPQSTADTAIP